jgi:predicted transcriptional regulator
MHINQPEKYMKEARKPHALLDAIREEGGYRSDTHMAEMLGYSKGRICEYRKGYHISADFLLTIQRTLGWSIKKIDALLVQEAK